MFSVVLICINMHYLVLRIKHRVSYSVELGNLDAAPRRQRSTWWIESGDVQMVGAHPHHPRGLALRVNGLVDALTITLFPSRLGRDK